MINLKKLIAIFYSLIPVAVIAMDNNNNLITQKRGSQILINMTPQYEQKTFDQQLLRLATQDTSLKRFISRNQIFYKMFASKVLLVGDRGVGKKTIALGIAARYGFNIEVIDSGTLDNNQIINLGRLLRSNYNPHIVLLYNIHDGTASAVLNLISEIKTTAHKIIGTTNSLENLPEKFLKKFETQYHIPLPSFEARKNIISFYIEKNYLDSTPALINNMAKQTDSFKRADLELLVNHIAESANKRCAKYEIDKKSTIENNDLFNALQLCKKQLILKNPYAPYFDVIKKELKDKGPELLMIAATFLQSQLQGNNNNFEIDIEAAQRSNGILDKIVKCQIL